MNDAQSTIVGLKAQECPGGGWNGMPAELEGKATVADCLAHGTCGCIYGGAVQHIERLRADRNILLAAIKPFARAAYYAVQELGHYRRAYEAVCVVQQRPPVGTPCQHTPCKFPNCGCDDPIP